MTRKLATIRRIDEIRPIEGADAIEAAVVGGWVVVVKKCEFKAGDLAVYLEIDSWVPNELAPFLSKGNDPREYNGVRGERFPRTLVTLVPIRRIYQIGERRNLLLGRLLVFQTDNLGNRALETVHLMRV